MRTFSVGQGDSGVLEGANPALVRKLEQSGELNRLLRQMSDWTFDQMYQLGVIEKMPRNRALEMVRDNWSLPAGG